MTSESGTPFSPLRIKAEQFLKRAASAAESPVDQDMKAVIHDLRVHQVELEMQNTELKKIQEDLEAAKEKYFHLFNQAPVGYISVDTSGIVYQLNQAFAEMIGMDIPKINRRPLVQFIHEKDRDLFLSRFSRFFHGTRNDSFDVRINTDSGKIIYVQLAIQADIKMRKGGSRVDEILIAISDITDKKKIEHALWENKNRLNNIIDDIPAMVCRFDPKGIISYANKEFYSYFSQNLGASLGENFFDSMPLKTRKYLKKQFSRLTVDKPVKTIEYKTDDDPSGSRWQRWTIRTIFDGAGAVRTYQTIGYDITEQIQIQQEKEEKEKLQGIVELAGAVCHEIRQPLQILVGLTDLISMRMPEDADLSKDLDRLVKQTERINLALHQLEHITRYETKPYVGQSKIIDLKNASDRRKSRRYRPKEPVTVRFEEDTLRTAQLIDIGKGGLSFRGNGGFIDIDNRISHTCSLIDCSGNTCVDTLHCMFITNRTPDETERIRAQKTALYRAKFIDLDHEQRHQINRFIHQQTLH